MSIKNNLILSGGWAHNFEKSVPHVVETLDEVGFASDVVFDISDSIKLLETKTYDLITVLACWFQMQDPRYSQQNREIWSRATSQRWRETMLRHKNSGTGLLAMHTATICFDDWSEWPKWVGGSWDWQKSSHPPLGELSVAPCADHVIAAGVESFSIRDEMYSNLLRDDSSQVILQSTDGKSTQPTLWVSESKPGRVVYNALGHDLVSVAHLTHRQLIKRSALWACRASDAQVEAVNL